MNVYTIAKLADVMKLIEDIKSRILSESNELELNQIQENLVSLLKMEMEK